MQDRIIQQSPLQTKLSNNGETQETYLNNDRALDKINQGIISRSVSQSSMNKDDYLKTVENRRLSRMQYNQYNKATRQPSQKSKISAETQNVSPVANQGQNKVRYENDG